MTPRLTVLPASEQVPLAGRPYACWRTTEGEVAAQFHRTGAGFTVRFIDQADFLVSPRLDAVECVPVPDVSERTARDLFLNQVMPVIRGQQGELVLHASAVAVADGVLAFAAPTGRGKSTLAAAFASAGYPFLTDDGLTLTSDGADYTAHANRPSFRLRQDSTAALNLAPSDAGAEDEKVRVEAGPALPFGDASLPLRALYFLGPGDAASCSIEPLSHRQAVVELISHAFLLDVEDRPRLRRHFGELGDLAEGVACFSLDYPRDYAALPGVVACVADHAAALRAPDRG